MFPLDEGGSKKFKDRSSKTMETGDQILNFHLPHSSDGQSTNQINVNAYV